MRALCYESTLTARATCTTSSKGCDYQFQNAELVYRSTDWIIDTINAHPEWGVHVQYTTPREYLAKVKASAVATDTKFPVKTNGSHFFPFGDWSGYFTSRCVRCACIVPLRYACYPCFMAAPRSRTAPHYDCTMLYGHYTIHNL